MSRSKPKFSMRAVLREALIAAGDAGTTLPELEAATGADRVAIQRGLDGLGEMGEKFSAPTSTPKLWRHFATKAQRDAWQGDKPRVALSADELRSIRIHADKVRGSKMAPPPLGRRTVPQEVRTPVDVVRTVAVTPRGRFEPDPGFRGPFSLAGVGRDVQTGRGWA